MSEPAQGYFTLGGETEQTNPGFQSTLDYIRESRSHPNTEKVSFSSG